MGSGVIVYRWSVAKQDLSGHGFMGFGRLAAERDSRVAVSAVELVAPDWARGRWRWRRSSANSSRRDERRRGSSGSDGPMTQGRDAAVAFTHPATAARSSSSANGLGRVASARACTRCAAGASGAR
jgi:hypothetical protein